MVGFLRPRTVYLKSNECALFSVSLRCVFSVSSSPDCSNNPVIIQLAVKSSINLPYVPDEGGGGGGGGRTYH